MVGFKPCVIQIILQKSLRSPTDELVNQCGLGCETHTWLRVLPHQGLWDLTFSFECVTAQTSHHYFSALHSSRKPFTQEGTGGK